MTYKNIFNLTNLTQVTALALSSVAAWFAIAGLISIFPARATGIIIMGGMIEIAKIVAVVWLRKYWHQAGYQFKLLLIPMIVISMLLTSMGTFGFLSAAHSEQSMVSGDVSAKIAIYDEKIKTQRDNIEMARKALAQLDAQVDARLNRGGSEAGAERAVTIRRQQQQERNRLQKEILEAQTIIAKLNEERAPIASQLRKVEAEVGPIKYIAALVYNDNPDTNTLEKAVRWVIILLVIVFDPFAIALVIAASSSRQWDKNNDHNKNEIDINPETNNDTINSFTKQETEIIDKPIETENKVEPLVNTTIQPENNMIETCNEREPDSTKIIKYPYLDKGFKFPKDLAREKPVVYNPSYEENNPTVETKPVWYSENLDLFNTVENNVNDRQSQVDEITVDSTEIITEGVTNEHPWVELADGYVKYDGKVLQKSALKRLYPNLFLEVDGTPPAKSNFGIQFPKVSNKGDIFVRVDVLPNRVYKFEGSKWIEINKNFSTSYLNDDYVQFLINKIYTGEYDIETLSENERIQIEAFLKNQKN